MNRFYWDCVVTVEKDKLGYHTPTSNMNPATMYGRGWGLEFDPVWFPGSQEETKRILFRADVEESES